ncbi:MMPL family transporter [Paenibacillus sp. NPDC056579]|uniref:MMPL family transporter n=1 Tax=Paenibacillus sp. NPDC056579 TaxID=3345871 RepID=UPI003684CF84
MGYRKLAFLCLQYPKTIIIIWTVFLVLFGAYAHKLPSVLKNHGLLADESYAKVQQIVSSEFHIPDDPIILIFEKKETVTPDQFRRFIEKALLNVKGTDDLTDIISPLERPGMLSENHAYALLALQKTSYDLKPVIDDIHRRLPKAAGISVKITGKPVVQSDVNQASRNDLGKAERIGLPAAFIILWIAFGGVASAMLPVIIGVVSVTGTMGLMYWIGKELELSNFVLNVIPMVGLALSIDFALLLVSRFREELSRHPLEQALITTMQTAGRSVVFSAAAVLLALAGTLHIPLPIFTSVALGAMVVLLISVCLTLTLLPALFTLLWPVIQAETMPLSSISRSNIWYTWSQYVMQRPVRMGLLALMILTGCFLPLSRMEVAIPDAQSLPKDYESRVAAQSYQTRFVDPSTSQVLVVATGAFNSSSNEDWLKAFALVQRIEKEPEVKQVKSVFSALKLPPGQLHYLFQQHYGRGKYAPVLPAFVTANRMLLEVTIEGEPSSKQAMDWVRKWEGMSADMPFLLGGEAKYQQEVYDAIFNNIKDVVLFIVISNYIVLFAAFRSVLIPIKTICMNLLSLGASFGILTWMYNEEALGMEQSSIAIMIPVFVFGLVFGISMDYGVFLVSRIFEVYQQTRDNNRAVLIGLASTSRMITSAAAIMIAVTLPFAFGEVIGVKQLGIGIAAAIFIDATIIRLILIPALMKWLGSWNWWAPGWLKKG